MAERKASVERDTLETQIKASINLDGTGKARFDIGVPFLSTCWTRSPVTG
jgi:imidazoleglycerol-phosphate dehydratase